MPHCIIEYSQQLEKELDIKAMLLAVHQGAVASQLFTVSDIKVRALPYTWHYAEANHNQFIHITVRLLKGRTPEQKKHLSESVLQSLSKLALPKISTLLTVEVLDIDTSSYSKLEHN
ncbi:5-carboxymethyl-2-hydroxymuconate Delta-isomerase [Marinomonas agarivorans]|nr:5-carboxymethyl-2-hydroxymuconate Delta-isomerase [Marinomonas agarivorans]